MEISIYFDGACNNHLEQPPAGVGVAVFFNEEYQEDLSRAIPILPNELKIRNTNNTTEWQACIHAMLIFIEIKKHYPLHEINIYSDSQVVTQVFNGKHETHTPEFIKYKDKAHHIVREYDQMLIEWVPREMNKQADKLSKEGLQIAIEKLSGTLSDENTKSTKRISKGHSINL